MKTGIAYLALVASTAAAFTVAGPQKQQSRTTRLFAKAAASKEEDIEMTRQVRALDVVDC